MEFEWAGPAVTFLFSLIDQSWSSPKNSQRLGNARAARLTWRLRINVCTCAAFVKKPDIVCEADIAFFTDNIEELSFISSFGVLPEVDVSPGARARGVCRFSMRLSSIMRS